MKKILFTVLSLCSIVSFAQDKLTNYKLSYFKDSCDISISVEKKIYSLYIDEYSLDSKVKKGGIIISQTNHAAFIKSLEDAKIKYNEWVQTAKTNKVTSLDKELPVSANADGYFLYGTKWCFDFGLKLQFDFKILESSGELKYLMIVRTGKMTASSNEYMTADNFVLVFSNPEEIDYFIKLISEEAAKKAIEKEELFK